MTERRDLVKELLDAGFESHGGTNHEKFKHKDGRIKMLHLYEFEIFEDEGWYLALPFDWVGGTQGVSFGDACEMAADWLRIMCEDCAMYGKEFPVPSFGNEPRHGGRVVLLGIEAGLDTIRKVSAAEAARLLGVTPGRVTQMLDSNKLEGWREGRRTWVTVDSVEARLAERPKAGRPKKEPSGALAMEVGSSNT